MDEKIVLALIIVFIVIIIDVVLQVRKRLKRNKDMVLEYTEYLVNKYGETYEFLNINNSYAIVKTQDNYTFYVYKNYDGIHDNKNFAVCGAKLGEYFRINLGAYDNISLNCRVNSMDIDADLSKFSIDKLKEMSDNLIITIVVAIFCDEPDESLLKEISNKCKQLGFKNLSIEAAFIKAVNEQEATKFVMLANLGLEDWSGYNGHILLMEVY